MNQNVERHFREVDPILFTALSRMSSKRESLKPRITTDYFADLCEAIINQQLSEKAGATIFGRFKSLLKGGRITAGKVLRLSDQSIRDSGASWSKARFIKDLATKVHKKEIALQRLAVLSNAEVIQQLTSISGIGPWTAEMFLMFSLGREDVFSYGDVGLRRAIQKLYAFKKEPTQKQIKKLETRWAPYRTYACRILWRSLDAVEAQ